MAGIQRYAEKREKTETERAKGPGAGKAKPQGKKISRKLILILVPVLFGAALVAAGVMCGGYNLFGGRDAIIGFLSSMDAEYQSVSAREAILDAREEALASKEESLAKREAALAEAEAKSKTNEGSFEATIAGLSEERIAQYEQLGTIFSNMEAEPAAEALSEIGSVMEMAIVIYYMRPESSAKVLNNMDPKLAARITESCSIEASLQGSG